MSQNEHWARTRVRTCRDLRRGAWYRVARATPAEGVLEVNRRLVTVPRTFLQILPFRPQLWSVVPRVANAPQPPLSWGPSYGVCPQCSARASLGQHALKVSCPRCNGLFPVVVGSPPASLAAPAAFLSGTPRQCHPTLHTAASIDAHRNRITTTLPHDASTHAVAPVDEASTLHNGDISSQ